MKIKTVLKFAKDIKARDIRAFAREVIEAYESKKYNSDFIVDTSEGKYRFIHDSTITETFADEIRALADVCYDIEGIKKKMGNVGKYFEFDYDAFIHDCESDGYGHHFSGYDGSEEHEDNYYMFRVN